LGTAKVNPIELLVEIIKEYVPEDIWQGSPLIGYRNLGNTNRGQIGEAFVCRYLSGAGIEVEEGSRRTAETDCKIANLRFEVKTASLGANGTFQFNHVRLDRHYAYLLCLGICPDEIVYGLWRKGDVAEGRAGTLVRMAEGQAVTYKLTKQRASMTPIQELPEAIRALTEEK
jgi:hypothetical protein